MAKLCVSPLHHHLIISLTIITLTHSSSHAQHPTNPKPPFKNVYAFGVSFTDTGNTKSTPGRATFVSYPPYGRTFFHRPTNRYSDGRLVVDFLMQSLSLPFLPPYLDQSADKSHGVNFAVSGSRAIEHISSVGSVDNIPQSLGKQLEWFEKLLQEKGCVDSATTPRECGVVFNNALIWVGEMGANDYGYSYRSNVPPHAVQPLVIYKVTDFLQALLKKGAKYVVVQGLPPLGCLTFSLKLVSPVDRDVNGCAWSINHLSFSHNAILKSKLHSFRKTFNQSLIFYADYYNAYLNVLKNASSYGFQEVFKLCCGIINGGENSYNSSYPSPTCGAPSSKSCPHPSRYINWDGFHLTEAMYRVMADAYFNGSYTQPRFSDLLSKKAQLTTSGASVVNPFFLLIVMVVSGAFMFTQD